jgi:hypothetical protein
VWVHQLGGVSTRPEQDRASTDRLFNWHPVLMTLGFGVLMTEAVLAYKAPWQQSYSRWVSFCCLLLQLLLLLVLCVVNLVHLLQNPLTELLSASHASITCSDATAPAAVVGVQGTHLSNGISHNIYAAVCMFGANPIKHLLSSQQLAQLEESQI